MNSELPRITTRLLLITNNGKSALSTAAGSPRHLQSKTNKWLEYYDLNSKPKHSWRYFFFFSQAAWKSCVQGLWDHRRCRRTTQGQIYISYTKNKGVFRSLCHGSRSRGWHGMDSKVLCTKTALATSGAPLRIMATIGGGGGGSRKNRPADTCYANYFYDIICRGICLTTKTAPPCTAMRHPVIIQAWWGVGLFLKIDKYVVSILLSHTIRKKKDEICSFCKGSFSLSALTHRASDALGVKVRGPLESAIFNPLMTIYIQLWGNIFNQFMGWA